MATNVDRTSPAGALRALAEGADGDWFDSVLAGGIAAVIDGTPELPRDGLLQSQLRLAGAEALRSCFPALAYDRGSADDVPTAGIEFARTLARRGVALSVLLKAFRVGQVYLWRTGMSRAEPLVPDPQLRLEVLSLAWDRLNRWMEIMLDRLGEIHEDERDRWMRGALARRDETVDAILSGTEQDVDHAGWALGHDLHRFQLALIAWTAPAPADARTDAFPRLERAASTLAAAAGTERPVTRSTAATELCAWLGTDAALTTETLRGVEEELRASGVHVAIGRPGRGLIGFRRSHEQARAAQTVALGVHGSATITGYDEVELIFLVSRDPQAMRAMIAHELGGLLGSDPLSARLRATALAYLATGRSTAGAAQRLATHRNTVMYRVTQIEERLGRSLREHDLQLELALQLAELYGIPDQPDAS